MECFVKLGLDLYKLACGCGSQIGFATRSYKTLGTGYIYQITQGSAPDGVYAGSEEGLDVFDMANNSVRNSDLTRGVTQT